MRGKALKAPFLEVIFGITPAYAGKRKDRAKVRVASEDHPRVCGEKFCPV